MRQQVPASIRHRHAPVLRPISLAIGLLVGGPASFALPQGATPTAGQATVAVTAPGQMSIVQSTVKAGLDWTSFSIAAGESVNVVQPGRTSVLLNRVLGDDPSSIYGSLTSNGSVWLINPRGIVFGASSRVDVGGLLASTLGLQNQSVDDALATGRLQLGAGAGTPGALRAEGSITATDGSAVLVSPQLMQSGSISARRVGLAAASDVLVDVEGDGLIFFNVRNDRLDARLDQLGSVRADGGLAEMRAAARAGFADTVLNLDGIVQARSIGVQQGRIVIDGGSSGITRVGGTLDTTSTTGTGGSVLVQGQKILVDSAALLDASGSAGGGSVLVGGDFQGSNAEVRNASMVSVRGGARLAANALADGDGGKVIVWSDDATRFLGAADVRGGAQGGNGGLVEVSGKALLDFRGTSDRSAQHGQAGLLLLDPFDLRIQTNGADIDGQGGGDLQSHNLDFDFPDAVTDSIITGNAVSAQLLTGAVTLQAHNDILVNAAINAGNGRDLTLQAGGSIVVGSAITLSGTFNGNGAKLTLSANDNGAGSATGAGQVTVSAALSTSGSIVLTNNGTGTGVHTVAANLTADSLQVTGGLNVTGASTWTLANATTIGTLGGSAALNKAGAGVLTLTDATGYSGALTLDAGGLTLNGALASTLVTVNGGIFTAGVGSVFDAAAALQVNNGSTLVLNADQSVTSLSLDGTLSSAGNNLLTASGAFTSANAVVGTSSTLLARVSADTADISGTLTVGNGGTAGALSAATSLTVNPGAVLAYNNSGDITLDAIAGGGTLRQLGGGKLQLGGVGQVSTNIEVNNGSVVLLTGNTDRLLDTASVTVTNGAHFTVDNSAETIGSLVLNGGTVDSTTPTASHVLTTGTFSSSTAASSLLIATQAVTSSSVTGTTLTVGNGSTFGALTGATVTLSNADLVYQRSDAVTLNTAVTGTGNLQQSGTGVLTLGALVDVTGIHIGTNSTLATAVAGGSIGSATTVTADSGATFTVNGTESIGALTLTGATAGGPGALTAASLATSNGSNTTATLAMALTLAADATVASGSRLTLVDGGSLAFSTLGTGVRLDDATLAFNGSTSGTAFSIGNVTGLNAGASTLLVQQGTLTLTGRVANVNTLQATGASSLTLLAGSTDRIDDNTAVSIGSGTLTLNGNESIASLTLAGTLTGNGNTLSAGSYTLQNGAVVDAALGGSGSTLTSNGSVTLRQTVASGTVNVNSGTLTLDSASGLLASGASVQLTGAALVLGADETITSLTVAGTQATVATLTGNGHTLSAGGFTLQDRSTIDAALGNSSATLTSDGAVTLKGTVASTTVNVNSGTLTLDGAGALLASGASVQLTGATLSLGADQTISALTMAGTQATVATLTGNGHTLSAGSFTLQDRSTVDAGLGNGSSTLTSTGAVTLKRSVASNTVNVDSGTLTLDSTSGLLASGASVQLTGATLALGADEAITSLSMAGTQATVATLTGNGHTLSADSFTLQDRSTVNAALGRSSGTLTSSGAVTLQQAVASNTVTVDGGTLTLAGSAGLLASGATAQVRNGALLTLAHDETITALQFSGTGTNTVTGAGSLTTSSLTASGTAQISNTVRTTDGTVQTASTLTVGTAGPGSTGSLAATGNLTLADSSSTLAFTGGTQAQSLRNVLGAGTLRQGGSGTLTLTGTANALTLLDITNAGGTVVLAGSAAQLGSGTSVSIGSNAALQLAGNAETIGALTLAGTLRGTGSLTTGTLTASGNAAQISSAVTTTDASVLANSTLTVGAVGANPGRLTSTGNLQLTGSSTLVFAGSTSNALNNVLGAGTLRQGGSGTLTLNGTANALTLLDITNAGGTVVLAGSAAQLGGGTNLAVASGGTLQTGSNAETVNTLNLSGLLSGSGALSTNNGSTLVGGTVSGTLGGAVLVSTASGITTSTLTGRTLGNVTIDNNGELQVNAGGNLSDSGSVTVRSGSRLTLNSSDSIGSLSLAGTLAGTGSLTTGTLTASGNAAQISSAVTTTDANVLANSTLTVGAVGANPGRLTSTGNLQLTGSSTLVFAGSTSNTLNNVLGAGTLRQGGSGTLTLNGTANALTLLDITNAGGTVVLAGSAAQLGGGTNLAVASGGTLQTGSNAETVNTLNLSGLLSGSGALSTNNGSTLVGATVSGTLGGTVLVSTAAGVTTSTLTGRTLGNVTIDNNGELQVNAGGNLSDSGSVTVRSGSRLTLNSSDSIGSFSLAGTLGGSGTLATLGDAGSTLLAGAVVQLGSTLTGGVGVGGTVASGTVHVTGDATVNGRLAGTRLEITAPSTTTTLTLGATADRLGDSMAVDIGNNSTLLLQHDERIGTLSGNGTVAGNFTLSTNLLTLNNQSVRVGSTLETDNFTSSGISAIRGDVRVLHDATVTDGTLTVGDGGTNGSLTVGDVFTVNGTLAYNRSDTVTLGNIVGSGRLQQLGLGNLVLGGTVALPFIDINSGLLTLAASNTNRLTNNDVQVTVGKDGAFKLASSAETIKTLLLSGELQTGGTLTADTYTLRSDTSGNTVSVSHVNGALGSGALVVQGTAVMNGAAAVGSIDVEGSGYLSLTGAAGQLSAAPTLRIVDTQGRVTLGANTTVASLDTAGHLDGDAGGNAFTLTANAGSTLRSGAVVDSNLAGGALVVLGNSTLNGRALLTGTNATASIGGGTLVLGSAADRLRDIAVSVAANGGLALASDQTIGTLSLAGTLTGNGHLLTAASYTLLDQARVNGALGGGTLTSDGTVTLSNTAAAGTVTVQSGTLSLAAANLLADTANLTVRSGAHLALGGNDTVRSLTLLGSLDGSGRTLTTTAGITLQGATVAANLVSNTLMVASSGNASTLAGTATVTTQLTVDNGGSLALAAGNGRLLGAPTVAVNGLLTLGGDETLGSLSGAGSGVVQLANHTLTTGNTSSSSFAGNLAGSGGQLVKQGSGSFTLTGNNGYTGSTSVNAGTLVVGGTLASALLQTSNTNSTLSLTASNLLADTATVNVGSNTSLLLGGSDTIFRLNLNGTVAGSGTLTATDRYVLAGGQVNTGANLGSGWLMSSGASRLDGSSAATVVDVTSDTLTLGAANRLVGNNAVVTVDSLATLALAGSQTLAGANSSFVLRGHLQGGLFSAAAATLDSGTVDSNASLGAGTLTSTGSSSLLGSSAATSVTVASDTLTLGSANRLTGTPTVTVANNATLAYSGAQNVGALLLVGGLQGDSSSVFTAPTTTLQGGTVAATARLGIGSLAVTADSTLAGTSGATAVTVGDSTHNARLTLASANRLASTATVNVAEDSTLRLNGDQTINRLNLSGIVDAAAGTPSVLTAATYALNGGEVDTALGAGALTSVGTSTLNAQAAAGTVQVNGGTLTLAVANALLGTASVIVNNATLNASAATTLASLALNSSTLNGSGVLTAGSYTLNTGIVNGNLGTGDLISSGTSQLNGSANVSTLAVTGGVLTLSGNSLSNAPTTTLSSGATLSLGSDERIGTLAGSGTLALGSHTLTTGAASGSTFSGTITGTGSGGLNKVGDGNFTLAGTNSYAGPTHVMAGTLTTTSANALPDTSAVTVDTGATLALGGNDTVASLVLAGKLNGTATLTAASYTLDSGEANANLGAGSLTSTGISKLNGTSGAATVLVADGSLTLGSGDRLADNAAVRVLRFATLRLNGNDTIGTLDLSGTVTGTGVLNASSYVLNGGVYDLDLGTGTLTSNDDSTLNGSSAAAIVQINTGTLTLGSAHRFSAAPAVTINSGAALTLGGEETLGTLAGAGNVHLGAFTLITGSRGDSLFSGVLDGSGGLTKLGSGSFTLAGLNSYGGATTVSGGTLATSAADVLPDLSAVTVASGAALALGGNDTVASLLLAGRLNGTATLTAGSYTLNSGIVNAQLGVGSLVSSGSSQLNNTAGATSITVDGGTLALGAANLLADTATVQVAHGATLLLGGNDTVGSIVLGSTAAGTPAAVLAGNGTLSAGSLTTHGSSTLNANAAVATLLVADGSLTISGSQRLNASTTLDVANGATLVLAADQTAGLLTGAGNVNLASFTFSTGSAGDSSFGGVLSGTGGLVKQGTSTFTLTGNSSYSGATSVDGGTLLLSGTLASNPVTVAANSSLVLTAADRLADTASVSVGNGAHFTLNGNERIAALSLNHGTLDGSGQLTATTVALRDATVDAGLGAGALTSGGTSTLNGQAASTSLAVTDGTLLLATDNRLTATPDVTITSGALLRFGGAQSLGTLAGNGGLDLGSSTLTVGVIGGSAADTTFGGVLQGSGGLIKQGNSTLTLAGNNSYSGSTRVDGGNLRLAGTLASTQVAVTGGTLALLAADRLADTSTVTVSAPGVLTLAGNDTVASLVLAGRLGGSGTLTAGSYTLTGATVDADLGTGTLTTSGNTRLNGRADASSVTVLEDGTLTLGAANRLADNAAVAVQRHATLALTGDDTVATLTLAGTLANAGATTSTLTAASVALDNGTVNANLGGGTLVSSNDSAVNGVLAASSVLVNSGTLTLGTHARLTALPSVSINNGAVLAMNGDEAFGSLAGAGELHLGSFMLTTGSGGDSIFAGVASGSGGFIKQGASIFTLSGANSYSGATTVQAGTLRIGDGGTSGSVANSSGFAVEGTLRFEHSDDVALAQAVSGGGTLEQAGSGRLLLSGSNKSYSGGTLVSKGELATASADVLPDNGAVQVATGARLTLGGRETLRTLDADGAVALGGDLTASGDLLLHGAVTVAGDQAITLSGQRITADNDGNVWGSSLGINAGGLLTLSSGLKGGAGSAHRDLTLATLTAAAGGRIDAGITTLSAVTTLSGGTLQLVSSAERTLLAPGAELSGKIAGSLPIAYADDAVLQTAGSRINVATGAALQVTASNGGSVQLFNNDNAFLGELSVLSGAANSPWAVSATQNYALQGRVRVAGTTVNIGGAGIEADVVYIRADRLDTVGSTSVIVARLPFDSTLGTAVSLPALTLELTPQAFNTPFPFGESGVGNGLRVNVGSRAWGNRTLPLDAGYITVLPRGGASGSTAVLLEGPAASLAGGYQFFFDGAGRQGEIPVFYNGVLPTTPQVENSISATVAVSEAARKERFEEAIRTENVALRLRAGVIAEVGPAPSATQGSEGVRVPATCPPAGNTLLCPVPQGPRVAPAGTAP